MSAIFAEYQHLNLDKNKMTVFLCHRKTTKIMFLHVIACWEIARILGSVCSFPHIFHIYTKSTATVHSHRPTTEISRLLWSQIPKYAVVGQEIHHEQRAKFANEVNHITRFFKKVVSQLPSCLMMLIRQPLKMKNGCELTKNRRYTIFEPLLQFNEVK